MRAWLATILRRLFLTGAIKAKRRGTQTDTDSGDIIMLSGARPKEAFYEIINAELARN